MMGSLPWVAVGKAGSKNALSILEPIKMDVCKYKAVKTWIHNFACWAFSTKPQWQGPRLRLIYWAQFGPIGEGCNGPAFGLH